MLPEAEEPVEDYPSTSGVAVVWFSASTATIFRTCRAEIPFRSYRHDAMMNKTPAHVCLASVCARARRRHY
jgi:hypothetical protein